MATIKDVAKLAGVSISTASYALNGSNKVSEITRKKVFKAAKELNYTPNKLAKNLKQTKSKLITLIVNEVFGPFYNQLIKGIQDTIYILGYDLIVFIESGYDRVKSVDFLKNNDNIEGVIIEAPLLTDENIKEIKKLGIPLVLLDRKMEDTPSILINNDKGIFDAVEHLVKLGHKNIGFINGPKDSYDNLCRFDSFKKALKYFDLDFNKDFILNGDFTEEYGYYAMKEFLENSSNIPTAFISSNDEMLIGAIQALKEKNIKIPKDISLIGFDDIKELKYISPKITTIRRPIFELGSYAAHTLLNLSDGKMVPPNILLEVKLIERTSTSKPRDLNDK